MANEDDKTVVKGGAGATDPGEKEEKKGPSRKLILFGGIGLGAIIVGVVVALLVIKPMMSDAGEGSGGDETGRVEQSHKAKKDTEKKTEHKKPPRKKKSGHGSQETSIYTIENIVVNPAGTGGSRFLSVSFGFEIKSRELAREFEEKEPIIRDALITILSSKTVAQLTDPKQKEIVRYQIKKRVSKLMRTDELAGVYYTDFVLQ